MIGPGYPINPPGVQPPLHSLTQTAVFPPDEPDDRWMLGFEFEPLGTIPVIAYPGAWCEGDDAKPQKPAEAPPQLITYTPFMLVTSYSCPWGRTEEERHARVRAQLELGRSKALERELWTGEADNTGENMALVRPNAGAVDETAIVNPGYDPGTDAPGDAVAVDLVSGLAALGQALANHGNGQRGMIHMTSYVAEIAVSGGLFVEDTRGGSSRLLTKGRGDFVVVGAGYPGTGPGGITPAAGQTWIHATGMVHIRLSNDVTVLPAIGDMGRGMVRTSNSEITHIAEQVAAVYWDGVDHASVLVDLAAGWAVGGTGE